MPRLHNPTEYRLSYDRIGSLLAPGETVEITDEQADALEHNTVFVVERKLSSKPERKTVKRGSKRAEVSKAPVRETRAKGLTTGDFFPK